MNDECASPRPDGRKTQQGQVNPTASKTTQISQTQNTIERKKERKNGSTESNDLQEHNVILEKKRKKERKKE